MAVTKTHPIKSTLKAAIDYILNPEKTDGKLLASSFGCGLETADIEFAWTREAAGDRGTHLIAPVMNKSSHAKQFLLPGYECYCNAAPIPFGGYASIPRLRPRQFSSAP